MTNLALNLSPTSTVPSSVSVCLHDLGLWVLVLEVREGEDAEST